MFLKQSAAFAPLKTLNEHGGCGSLMYNCHLMSLKGSPGDPNDNETQHELTGVPS